MNNLVTCNSCGWVSFAVSREYAVNQVKEFNEYFDSLDAESKRLYGNQKADFDFYERCFRCGGSFLNFRETKEGDCPEGCTIGPIIDRNDS